jgi:hypothetical protein
METRKPVKKKARERTQSEGPETKLTCHRLLDQHLNDDFEGLDGDLRTSIRILRASMATSGLRLRF